MKIVTGTSRNKGAVAVFVVLVLLTIMSSILTSQSMVLHQVGKELRQVQKNQERAWEQRWKRLSLDDNHHQPPAQPPGKGK